MTTPMTPTQRLAPMMRWAAECEKSGDLLAWEALLTVSCCELLLDTCDAVEVCRIMKSYHATLQGKLSERWQCFAWAYAIAYVLLTEEAGQ